MAEFDRFAQDYDEIHNRNIALSGEDTTFFARQKLAVVADCLARLKRPADGLTFLDVGCGTGKHEELLEEFFPGAASLSFDPSLESLNVAASRAIARCRFVCAEGEAIPFLADSADVALCVCVLHHMSDSAAQAMLSEVKRVLRSGGLLFVFEHNPLNPLTRRAVNTCEFDRDARLLGPGKVVEWCEAAGLECVRRQYTVFFPHALRALRFLEPKLGWLPLGAQYMILCRKT